MKNLGLKANASVAAIAIIMLSSTSALAQTAPAPEADRPASDGDIVVTGFRQSLDAATEIKRDADNISDVIAAEDIGKYPDQNIAESLQRVTGVQITRFRGEGNAISIRGLSPSFVQTQVNGHNIVSGTGRAFNFLDLSPDFVSAVEVKKSPTADMEDGGLSGTVDIRTPQPLDSKGTSLAARAEAIYNENRKKAGPRFSAIGTYVNDGGTFGVNVGVAYEKRKMLAYDLLGYGAETASESPAANASGSGKVPSVDYNGDGDFLDTYAFDHAQSYYVRYNDRVRFSLVSNLQYKPTDDVEIYANGLYAYYRDTDNGLDAATRYTNLAPAAPGGAFGVRGSVIDTSFTSQLLGGAQGFLTDFDADGLDIRADAQPSYQRDRVFSGTLGTKLTFDRLHVRVEGDYSQGRAYNNILLPSVIGRASAIITHPDGLAGGPKVTFTRGYDPLNASGFAFNTLYNGKQYNKDRLVEGKLDLGYDFDGSFLRKISVGGLFSDRHFTYKTFQAQTGAQQLATLSGGKLVFQPTVEQGSVNAAPVLSTISVKSGVPYFLPSFLYFDFDKFFSIISRDALEAASPPTEQLGAGNDIRERTLAAYVRADFASDDDRLSGNIGGRFVRTSLISKGFGSDLNNLQIAPGGVQTIVPPGGPLESRNKYNYFLPSLNVRYNITDSFTARFAAARVLARPEFNQLGVGLNVNANVLVINANNPDLKPYLADQIDLSFEYYLPKSGLISVAFFYKDVKNFIINGSTLDTRTARRSDGTPVTLTFRRFQPLNLEQVKIKGIEAGIQLPLDFLPGALDGFGILGNATYIDAPQVPQAQGGLPFPLPGVSKFSYNIGAYFEKWGFGARAIYNWRGKYDTGVEDYFGDREFTMAYGQLDGSISYDFGDVATVSINFENLTNSARKQQNNFGLARQYLDTGRRFTFGVRTKF